MEIIFQCYGTLIKINHFQKMNKRYVQKEMRMDKKNFKEPNITINKVYTKTGDSGETGLVGGQRLSKDDVRIEAYGEVDELNAFIGGCKYEIDSHINQCKELKSLSKGLTENLDSTYKEDEERLFQTNFELKQLIENLENSKKAENDK